MADRLAGALCRAREGLLVPLATTAGAFVRIEGWKALSFDSARDYLRERLDRTGSWLTDLATLDKTMTRSPSFRAALLGSDGKPALGQVAALAIARVATPETMSAWIEGARTVSVRELLDEVRRFKAEQSRGRGAGASNCFAGGSDPEPGDEPAVEPGLDEEPSPDETPFDPDPDPDPDHPDPDPTDDGERCQVRIPVAQFVIGVFDELRDIFGAVNGRDAGPAAVLEACLGESASSGVLPIVPDDRDIASIPEGLRMTPLRVGVEAAVTERAMAIATNRWQRLKDWDAVLLNERHEPKEWEGKKLRQTAQELLLRTFEVSVGAGRGDVLALEHQLEQMAELEDEIERYLYQHLAYMGRRRAWRELGFTSLAHYAMERLGLRRSTAIKRSLLASVLRRHARVRKAYQKGELGQEKSLLLHRLLMKGALSDEIELAWIRWAKTTSVKRLRDMVRLIERAKLDAAAGPPKLSAWEKARALRAAQGETATNCEPKLFDRYPKEELSLQGVQLPDPEPLLPVCDDATWIESIYRAPGMGLERLSRWGNHYIDGQENEPLPRATVLLKLRLVRDLAQDLVSTIHAWHGRVTAAALWQDLGKPAESYRDQAVLSMLSVKAARLFTDRSRKPPVWVGFLALLENAFRAWDDPALHRTHAAERTYRKANWRCMAPGCTRRGELQNHHIDFGNGKRVNAPWNLVCLCPFHHQEGIHGGLASVWGKSPLWLLFRLGRGEVARYYVNERQVGKPGVAA